MTAVVDAPSDRAEYLREWRKQNPESGRAAQRRYKERNPDAVVDGHLRRKYGITLMEYNALLDKQNGRCAICEGESPGQRRLDVDHDHETGAVRGLLCLGCNAGLGNLKDDPALLRIAAAYVEGGGASCL